MMKHDLLYTTIIEKDGSTFKRETLLAKILVSVFFIAALIVAVVTLVLSYNPQ